MCACVHVYVCAQGLSPALAARLAGWTFDMPRLHLCPRGALSNRDHPTALRAALRQLDTHITTPTPIIQLCDWHMTPELTQAIATALPAQSALRLGLHVGEQLTDTTLSQLRQMGPRMCSVSADKLSSKPALSIPWVWDSLSLSDVSLVGLAGLLSAPLPCNGGRRTVYYNTSYSDTCLTQVGLVLHGMLCMHYSKHILSMSRPFPKPGPIHRLHSSVCLSVCLCPANCRDFMHALPCRALVCALPCVVVMP